MNGGRRNLRFPTADWRVDWVDAPAHSARAGAPRVVTYVIDLFRENSVDSHIAQLTNTGIPALLGDSSATVHASDRSCSDVHVEQSRVGPRRAAAGPTAVIRGAELPCGLQSFASCLTCQAANGLLCESDARRAQVLLDIFVVFVCYTTFPSSNY